MNEETAVELPLWICISHAAGRIEQRLETALETTGLSLSKLAVLRQLMEAGEPIPLTQLARRLSCVKSNVTQLVDRLEEEELVRRIDDPDDRRSKRAVITPAGRLRYEVGSYALTTAEKELFQGLSSEDARVLRSLLEKLGS